MESYSGPMKGRTGSSSVLLAFVVVVAVVQGLLAVYKPQLFVAGATFWFSDQRTWGWIILGLAKLLFAQAFPLWSLVMTGVEIAAIYSPFTHGEEALVAAAQRRSRTTSGGRAPSEVTDVSSRRAA